VVVGQPAGSVDVVVVGGGHNGLTAAAYLARAGKSVVLLERQDHLGGAPVSAQAFAGIDARLSRYSYLVSLLPRQIVDDLGLDIRLARRRYASYTPVPGTDTGLLIDHGDPDATARSFTAIGAADDADSWGEFYARTARLADAIWPTMTEPVPRLGEIAAAIGDPSIVADFLERPLGGVVERTFASDLVRGVVLTDGLIGTYADAHQPDLQQNVCFLYHVIGGGTGDWDVPIGGMGHVSAELERAARAAGADLRAGAEVTGYELRADFAARARRNVESFLGSSVTDRYRIEVRDCYEGIDERDLDRVVLDLPEPWRVVPHAATALRPGGLLVSYTPSIVQVSQLRDALAKGPWIAAETVEVLQRGWYVEDQAVRPDHRMVGHTGFLTHARLAAG